VAVAGRRYAVAHSRVDGRGGEVRNPVWLASASSGAYSVAFASWKAAVQWWLSHASDGAASGFLGLMKIPRESSSGRQLRVPAS
jgi:hypothetical protein